MQTSPPNLFEINMITLVFVDCSEEGGHGVGHGVELYERLMHVVETDADGWGGRSVRPFGHPPKVKVAALLPS